MIKVELREAVYAYLREKAEEEAIREIVEGYQRRVLAEMRLAVSEEWTVAGEEPRVITDPSQAYLAGEKEYEQYALRLDEAKREAGFNLPAGYCPALVAKERVRQAARRVVEESLYLTGEPVTYSDFVRRNKLQEYVDTVVYLVVNSH